MGASVGSTGRVGAATGGPGRWFVEEVEEAARRFLPLSALSLPSAPQPAEGGAGTGHRSSALRVALEGGGEAAQLCRQWLACAEPALGLGNAGVEDLKPQALHAVRPADRPSRRAPG